MLNILISLLTFILILISLFLVLVILMQRANNSGGMGSAFGGGVAESAFGTETTNVLVKATKWAAVAFFVISLVLYLLFMSRDKSGSAIGESDLPDIPVAEQTEAGVPADNTLPDAGDVEEAAEDAAQTLSEELPAAAEEAAGEVPTPGT